MPTCRGGESPLGHGGKVLPPTVQPSPGEAIFNGSGPSSRAHIGIVDRVFPDGDLRRAVSARARLGIRAAAHARPGEGRGIVSARRRPCVFAVWFALRFVVRYALRFTPAHGAMAGFRLAGAGSRRLAFSEISLCGDLW